MSRLAAFLAVAAATALFASPARAADSPAPDYVVVSLQVHVSRPVEQVWKRVGDYCAISEWLKVTCHYSSGSGDVGTVRVINDTTIEPMVAKAKWSYTYTQTAGTMAAATYHGSVSVEPEGTDKSILRYVLVYNQNAFATDAERSAQHARIATRFQGALDAMKSEAESQP